MLSTQNYRYRMKEQMTPLLKVENLKISFGTDYGRVTAVDDVSFSIAPGETVALVGESGCGKSVTSHSIMRLIPTPPGSIDAGKVEFMGEDIFGKSEEEMEEIRGGLISMVFQEPMTSLNPVFCCGDQIMEAVMRHRSLSESEAREKTVDMMRLVGIPLPEKRFNEYPHQMSGGMRQRVMIAMALSCDPKLLIADEPTTALDVTIQAQILELLKSLQERLGMAVLLITHDLGVVAETVKRVIVMYAGRIVEEAPVELLFSSPMHPYTQGLLSSMPRLDEKKERLPVIPGNVPALNDMPSGCRFNPRCPYASDICRRETPMLLEISPGQRSSCFLHDESRKSKVQQDG